MIIDVKPIEFRKLTVEFVSPLMDFLHALEETGDDKRFHPHPFTIETVRALAIHAGKDLYYVLTEGNAVIGYAMLRGWDEGYEIPSLGISIHPLARKRGWGILFIHFLHAVAHRHGAKKVRLRVSANNKEAIQLYNKLGYEFQPIEENGYLVAYYSL